MIWTFRRIIPSFYLDPSSDLNITIYTWLRYFNHLTELNSGFPSLKNFWFLQVEKNPYLLFIFGIQKFRMLYYKVHVFIYVTLYLWFDYLCSQYNKIVYPIGRCFTLPHLSHCFIFKTDTHFPSHVCGVCVFHPNSSLFRM